MAATVYAQGTVVRLVNSKGKVEGEIVKSEGGWHLIRLADGSERAYREKHFTVVATTPEPAKTRALTLAEREGMAPTPVPPGYAAKASESESKPVPESAPAAAKDTAKAVKPTKAKPATAATAGVCKCGCGAPLKPRRHFAQGHDARFHGWMRRIANGELDPSEIPAAAAALMTIKAGMPTTDYDGSPWHCADVTHHKD